MTSPEGLLVIDKPVGMTSHGVVGVVRRCLGTRKVGHAGTLDPLATGVLIVGVGRATRLLGHLALRDKDYLATIRLGSTTVTDDREGESLTVAPADAVARVSDAEIATAITTFVGDIDQVPTAISAVKVDGRRAHARVRAGEQVDLAARRVYIARFDLVAVRRGDGFIDLDVDISCTTGTYVRALARDLGALLGIGGHVTALRRTRVGPWGEDEAIPLARVEAEPAAALRTLADSVSSAFPMVVVDESGAQWITHGRPLSEVLGEAVQVTTAIVDGHGKLRALVGPGESGPVYLAVFSA